MQRSSGKALSIILASVLAGVLGACGGAEGSQSAQSAAPSSVAGGGSEVIIQGTSFTVAELTIAAGSSVTFNNQSALAHNIVEGENGVAATGSRVSQPLSPSASAEISFDESGDYLITCTIHPVMNMVVHVTG
jgi:plastocyanin